MDSVFISRGGASLGIGSYLMADPGPDYDFGAVAQPQFAQNPFAEGAVLSWEQQGLRRFKFPLTLASSSAFTNGLVGLLSLVRSLAKGGAFVDIRPELASTLIRFDVVDGRLDEQYLLPIQRTGRRRATLELDVQPYGYSPTWIVLASSASVGLPGVLAIPGGSILGDAPAALKMQFAGTTATAYGIDAPLDTLAWSLSGQASFLALLSGASLSAAGSLISATVAATALFSPDGKSLRTILNPSGIWQTVGWYTVPAAVEPAYRGRHRLFAWARTTAPSYYFQVSGDAVGDLIVSRAALASSHPVATIAADGVASGGGAFQLIDLGALTLPPQGASGYAQNVAVRLWAKPGIASGASTYPASAVVQFGGLYLLPLDRGAGVLPRGLCQPTIGVGTVGTLRLDQTTNAVVIGGATSALDSIEAIANGRQWYRGDMPIGTPSTISLDILGAGRASGGATGTMWRTGLQRAGVSVSYRPRFVFSGEI